MRTPADALRSFKRHVALTLGPEWEVRLSSEEGAFNRPFARVGHVGNYTIRNAGAYQQQWRAQFQVVAHPVEKETPDDAKLEAERVRHLLYLALSGGGAAPARPKRIPLWDYAGIAAAQDVTASPAEVAANPALVLRPRGARDFIRADQNDVPNIGVLGDPQDELMYAVTATGFFGWWVSSASPPTGKVVVGIPVGPSAGLG